MILTGLGISARGSGSMVISNRRLGGKILAGCGRSCSKCGRTNSGMDRRLVTLPLPLTSGAGFAPCIFLAMLILPQFMCQKFGSTPPFYWVFGHRQKGRRTIRPDAAGVVPSGGGASPQMGEFATVNPAASPHDPEVCRA